jgi:thiol-disulfide isomerase/thioredoxin
LRSFRTTGKRCFADGRHGGVARRVGGLAAFGFALAGATACSRSERRPAESHAEAPATALPSAAAATEPGAPTEAAPAAEAPPPDGPSGPPAPAAGTLAPLDTVSAEVLLGEVKRLGGKGTLVNAWASWCGPCKHEIPMLQKLATKLEQGGVHVLLVSLDEPADREKAQAFLTTQKLSLTSYLAERPLGAFKQGMNPRWPGMLPASFLYDASGTLRYFWGGEAFENELTPVLDAFIAGRPIQGEASPAIAPEGEAR